MMVLSVVGVLGTAGAAMAVNSDTLTNAPVGLVGQATTVLEPISTPTATPPAVPAPAPTADVGATWTPLAPRPAGASTAVPAAGTAAEFAGDDSSPAPAAAPAPAATAPVAGTSGGSGASGAYDDDDDSSQDDDFAQDDSAHEDESDDDDD